MYLANSIVQFAAQPSFATIFPSSHSSEGCRNPSPHSATQAERSTFGVIPLPHPAQTSGVKFVPPLHT